MRKKIAPKTNGNEWFRWFILFATIFLVSVVTIAVASCANATPSGVVACEVDQFGEVRCHAGFRIEFGDDGVRRVVRK